MSIVPSPPMGGRGWRLPLIATSSGAPASTFLSTPSTTEQRTDRLIAFTMNSPSDWATSVRWRGGRLRTPIPPKNLTSGSGVLREPRLGEGEETT